MNKKYELTDESINIAGTTLYRIKALKSFDDVAEGELGGYIETEKNLSQDGNCWVSYGVVLYGDATVTDNAKVTGQSVVIDHARIFGDAFIAHSVVKDYAAVSGRSKVMLSKVFGHARVSGDAWVHYESIVKDYAQVSGHAEVFRKEVYGKQVKRS